MEHFGTEPSLVQGTIHGPGYCGNEGIAATHDAGVSLADDFHVYSVDWEPGRIRWYLDGALYGTATPGDLRGNPWVFDHDFFLIVNVAVGGTLSETPDSAAPFPQTVLIDYIRVSEKQLRPSHGGRSPLTCDRMVTYCPRCGRGVQGAGRPDPPGACSTSSIREDGQTLGALEARFAMTRFGVMKHLKQLEEAGLVVTRRQGREKLHFLNPVPIRLVHDRWVSKYAEPWAAGLSELKQKLESPMEKVFEIYIKTTPGAALGGDHRSRDPGQVQLRREHRLRLDGRLALRDAAPATSSSARARCSRPTRRAGSCTRMLAHFSPEDVKAEGTSRVTWEIEPVGRLVPTDGRARPDARGRERADLRRLADDPLGPQDLARDGRAAHDAGLADVHLIRLHHTVTHRVRSRH